MNTLLAATAHRTPLTTDAQIEDRVLALIGTAGHRQLWLMFLDHDDDQLPVVIPLDDLPRVPDRAQTDVLVGHLAGVLHQVAAVQIVLVWERPGKGKLTELDQAWARSIAENCSRRGVRLRAQLLSHTRGVTILHPADYALTPTAASSTGGTEC
ncbi:hypothetical protein B7R22_00095 [Subtercola boreus]|uniref:RadC-like JAB domain-containing protein n=1 Tax=Subtercola boreus TaxID=120213 RepID=A0A3E0W6Q4_9MICO|nr:hypothetical protein [Subtercola boreus]RFA17445.1 hypothetical protein B7R22_00095 [Subtercola boreus]